ncbi:acetolactate decarboxylase [Ulvibacter sp. MAR_2010_11]|uniref:hypothetical protein n=1 Tax=Ulvibacter sp. MAR_2010_11 TaxID=1250229 RepID=UPI000C2C2D7B|nr:hypothetical protein [Ulvibacter sp. MAR_2010_11]PKA82487.1 acetolactate decarboxylase [Ulvibacter sp. MAR_2010_11]
MKKILVLSIVGILTIQSCKEHQTNTNVASEGDRTEDVVKTAESVKPVSTKVQDTIYTKVESSGSLKDIMNGKMGATIALKDLEGIPNLYAIGALENLTGEILIYNSDPIISRRSDKMVTVDHTFKDSATLLVSAQVAEWQDIPVPTSVKSQGQFEIFLQQQALQRGVDTSKPYPFILTGGIAKLDWHVVNWNSNNADHTKKNHLQSSLKGVLTHAYVDILGFYDAKNDGVFIHEGSKTHMHFKARDANLAAHADKIFLGKDLTLKLPK